MTQRTRYFLLGSSLVVFVGLCTGLVAFYNGNLPFAASTSGPTELNYLPEDSTAVAYANVRGVMDSQFRQRLRQLLPSGEEKAKLHSEIGIDLEQDVDSVVAALAGPELNERSAIALVRGRFNNSLIESTAVQHGATVEEYKGKRIVVMEGHAAPSVEPGTQPAPTRDHGPATGALAFVEPGVIALGDLTAIKKSIDGAATGGITKNAEVMKFISEIDSASDAWVVGRFDAIAASADVPQQVKDHLPAVQWFMMSARVDTTVSGVMRAEARDDESGQQLRDVVRGALAAAQLVSGQDTRVDTMMRSLHVSGAGKSVSLSFTVPAEMLDVINGLAGLGHLTNDQDKTPAPTTGIKK